MTHLLHKTLPCLCLLLVSLSLKAFAAGAPPPPLPAWQALEFEQRAFWATAQSLVAVTPGPDNDQLWTLTASSSVVGNSEQVKLSFVPASGQAMVRSRLSRGKDQRFKFFDYQDDYIVRERRNPGADPHQPPSEWPVSSRKEIPYPADSADIVVTDAYTLLLLADRLQASSEESAEVVVHTEFNFYRVRMTCGNGIPITVDYQVTGADRVSGKRETRAVALQISELGDPVDKPDFSLLGLNGDIILFFDRASGLPVQVRGNAPRIGPTELNLKAVTPREPPA